ncbi:hypothetical protein HMSSN036_58370 [Paenibacillus macerans]|nr:hypothetical protein HMSSN036_58370 [Paenibacillus macerans]
MEAAAAVLRLDAVLVLADPVYFNVALAELAVNLGQHEGHPPFSATDEIGVNLGAFQHPALLEDPGVPLKYFL